MSRFDHLHNFGQCLRHWAAVKPYDTAFRFLTDGVVEAPQLSFAELDRRATAIAARLARECPSGGPVLLLYRPGLDFIAAFFGCLYAGCAAVPAYPPSGRATRRNRLTAIIADCGAGAILTSDDLVEAISEEIAQADLPSRASVIGTDALLAAPGEVSDAEGALLPASHLAFLQYTSGSTGRPKGVRVTHRNLLANERAIREGFRHGPDTVFVGWCPLYHDMGLIGNVLQPVYLGIPSVLMSPLEFLQQPLKWLRAISTYGATTSGGPNFAYELCATRIAEADKAGLDLSSWRVAFNGAEPIRASTLDKFATAFADYGFDAGAMFPCYGMAETTLFVSGAVPGAGALTRRVDALALQAGRCIDAVDGQPAAELVSSGRVGGDQQVRIVDPHGLRVSGPGEIGEIWVRGGSVADGYWNREDDTRAQFDARIAGEDSPPFLRTGDLGLLDGGELYVTGRLKELIIIRGRNHYPTDIEQTVEQSSADFRAGCGAAFAIDGEDGERLVVVQEIQRAVRKSLDAEEAGRRAAAAVAAAHGIPLHELVLVQAGVVPKTSSGKNQRTLVRQHYLNGELPVLARARPGAGAEAPAAAMPAAPLVPVDSVEALSERVIAAMLGAAGAARPEVRAASALALGLDSLALVDLQTRLAREFGVAVALDELMDDRPVAELARELAARALDGGGATDGATGGEAAAPPPPAVDPTALTPYQEAIWTAQLWDPSSPCFNLVLPLRIRMPLSATQVREALAALTVAHPNLASRFVEDGNGEVRQQPATASAGLLDVINCAGQSDDALRARIVASTGVPLDLFGGPVFRAELLSRAPDDHVLVLIAHHLVADLGSLQTVLADFAEFHACLAEGRPLPARATAAAAVPDYRARLAALLHEPRAQADRQYWAARLATPIEPLTLPLALPGETPAGHVAGAGMSVDIDLDAALTGALDTLCAGQRVTRNMALLAAFFAFLHRYTAQRDLAVVTPAAVRPGGEFDDWVGYGVNLLVIREAVDGELPFTALLAAMKQTVAGALAHRATPFIDLARRFARRDADVRHPFSRILFAYHNLNRLPQAADLLAGAAGQPLTVGTLALESFPVPTPAAQTDLTLVAIQAGERLVLRFEYDATLASRAAVERMAAHFLTLLGALIARPDQPVARAALLEATERERQFVTWNHRPLPAAPAGTNVAAEHTTVHAMIDAMARRVPERIAVRTDTEHLDYARLRHDSDALAAALHARGVRHGDVVGVGLPRDVRLPVILLAIWKAGAAYLPIDLGVPAERVRQMLDDAQATLIVAPAALQSALCDDGCTWVTPEALAADAPAAASPVAPDAGAGRDSLAYVLFTSGSTGRPKGVEIEHRNVLSLLAWIAASYSADELAAVFAGTSIAFDISVFELFGPLAHGGCVVIGENPATPPATPVSLINTVPSAAAALLETGRLPASVVTVNLAGEPLRQSLVDALYARGTIGKVYDLYGPTEDTVYSTAVLREPGGFDTIGTPLPGKRVYLLDAQGEPVPVGVAGELYLAGDGQARGYRHRPDLTEHAFVPVPALADLEPRLYRTGDIGRQLADGRIVLSGRRDHQVKVRGHRVELGEIEAVLLRHPAVRDAVVVQTRHTAPAGDGGDGQDALLVAYLASGDVPGEAGGIDAVREFAAASLPSYMRPAGYVLLEALPRNASGKVDRAALPRFDPVAHDAAAAPASDAQRAVLAIWEAVLGLQGFGIHADLFELGGHSLQAIRILTRCSEHFGVEIPLREVLERTTVADLAAYITLLAARSGAADEPGGAREEVLL
ncbi:amino acid adenylation domain-containing protein [Burkholderia sp. 22PA0099]|uniref:amino acid adenylation domain-containing protein n=1 Tax=Burkholderia sp. 22PA0099 TaxID=3237372 RepID=UPI0039C03D3A